MIFLQNTFILKRRYPPSLHKKNDKQRFLKPKHFIYDLVEDTNVRRKEFLDLILTQYVAGLGNVGTRVSMHPNKAYPVLLLPKLADYASPENIEKYTKLAVDQQDKTPFSSASVEKTIKYLSKRLIKIEMSKNVPWTLEKWHIRANLRRFGIYVPEEAITMPERSISGPNLDIERKQFYITLTINNREQVKMRCIVCHWPTDMAGQTYVEEYWKLPPEPIFPEDKPILDSLYYKKTKDKTE